MRDPIMEDTIQSDEMKAVSQPQKATFELSCYLLRTPIEIRLEIYRYLLLPSTVVYAAPDVTPDHTIPIHPFFHSEDGSEYDSDDDWTDATDEDSDHDSLVSEMMHDLEGAFHACEESDQESQGGSIKKEDKEDNDEDDGEAEKRHLAILRTNRKIHYEASALFYSEAVLTLDPGDIISPTRKLHPLERFLGYGQNSMAWKHNPIKGIGKRDEAGVVSYASPQLLGDLEPHIFAKFKKIAFDGYFNETLTGNQELWIDDETHVIKEEDAALFKSRLRSLTIFKELAKILSVSHQITHLEITLEVNVMAASNLILGDEIISDNEDFDEEKEMEMEMKVDRIMDIANFRATELFLESKIMNSLLKLSNVSHCSFKFGFDDLEEEEGYKPSAKYVKLLRSMKDKIESNFIEPMDES